MKKVIIRRQETTTLAPTADLHPLVKRIYENRGINNIKELDHNLTALIPYHSLQGIDEAVALLYEHIVKQKRIVIVGDFDADGATSSALAVAALKSFGIKEVSYLVPNRFEYGYGLTPEIVAVAAKWQPDLIITVDNGISSIEGVTAAHAKGIKVLVTDHHLAGAKLPAADAIVNPNQPGDSFPSKNLAGVGVIFYVMCALRRYLKEKNWFAEKNIKEPNMTAFLDLVALGTVADVVPLDQNNRILVHQGLRRIRAGHCCVGINALLEISKRSAAKLTAADLGFAIGPRLNAAGRLDDMSLGIECLLTENPEKAREYAQVLNELNQQRKSIEMDMKQQAMRELNKLELSQLNKTRTKLPLGLCLYDENWHQGVIGILASRIKDQFHRPVIAFAPGDQGDENGNNVMLKGSARSVNGFHIRDALDAVATKYPNLITKFGGHAMAAGLSLEKTKLSEFTQAFDKEVRNHLNENQLNAEIYSDGELNPEDFNLELAQVLQDAGPWGQHFPEPMFDGIFTIVSQRLVGSNHLKLTLKVDQAQQQQAPLLDGIIFNIDTNQWPNHRCEKIKAAYKLDINEYRGIQSVQLLLSHLEAAD